MGPERSLDAVRQKLGKSARLIQRWSSRWQWVERLAAHAQHLAVVEREATEALTRVKSAQWLKRQEEHRDDEWALRGELVEAGRRQLLKFRDGTKGATLGDVARALELASKLGRLATGMATDKTEVTGEDGGPIKVELEVALRKIYGAEAEVRADGHRSTSNVEVVEAEVIETGGHLSPALSPKGGEGAGTAGRMPATRSEDEDEDEKEDERK